MTPNTISARTTNPRISQMFTLPSLEVAEELLDVMHGRPRGCQRTQNEHDRQGNPHLRRQEDPYHREDHERQRKAPRMSTIARGTRISGGRKIHTTVRITSASAKPPE